MAVTLQATDLTAEDSTTFPAGSRTNRIVEAAALTVDRYAADCPDDISDEACYRYASALATATAHQNRHTVASGEMRVKFVIDDADLFRRCGAAGLLSPYRRRRGLAPTRIEDLP